MKNLSSHLFWDVDVNKVNLETSKKLIIQRVLEYGMIEDWIFIKKHYGLEEIVRVAKTLRDLDSISLNFIATISNTAKESFRCYTEKQSRLKHWIY